MASSRPSGQSELQLLRQTQQYLCALSQGEVPEAALADVWKEFYSEYGGLIRRSLIARGLRHDALEDCFQEVWLTVIVRLPGFRPTNGPHGFRAWLHTVARSRAVDLVRRRIRERAVAAGEDQGWQQPANQTARHSSFLNDSAPEKVLNVLVDRARSLVSDISFRLLRLRFLEGQSVAQVAAALNLSRRQVSYRQHRALKRLREDLTLSSLSAANDDGNGAQPVAR